MTQSFQEVPIILVHKDNITTYWPAIMYAIRSSSYLAMDLEMTGLGNRKELMSKCIETRYSHMKMVAETRSVLSIGLSCFRCNPVTETESPMSSSAVSAQTFNIVLLCEEDYMVEPLSLKFLVKHGFDFNQQYAQGVPYYRGNDQPNTTMDLARIRNLFSEIIRTQVPLVLHNGLVDLVYIYQNFYCQLPGKMETFTADLYEMFTAGIIDTKFIADYKIRWPASYLEYTFRRCQMENDAAMVSGKDHVIMTFPVYTDDNPDIEYRHCALPPRDIKREFPAVCENYAGHGNCRQADCRLSHDIDVVLGLELRDGVQYHKPKSNQRKRRKKNNDKLGWADRTKARKDQNDDVKKLQTGTSEILYGDSVKSGDNDNVKRAMDVATDNGDSASHSGSDFDLSKMELTSHSVTRVKDVNSVLSYSGAVKNTLGCTASKYIPTECTAVKCISTECKTVEVEAVEGVGTECKTAECIATECKTGECTASECSFVSHPTIKSVNDSSRNGANVEMNPISSNNDDESKQTDCHSSTLNTSKDILSFEKSNKRINDSEGSESVSSLVLANCAHKPESKSLNGNDQNSSGMEYSNTDITNTDTGRTEEMNAETKVNTKVNASLLPEIRNVSRLEVDSEISKVALNLSSNSLTDVNASATSELINASQSNKNIEKTETESETETRVKCSGHRAGFDAFMTGFVLASVLNERKLLNTEGIDFKEMNDIVNNVYMSGKDIPLQVRKSAFSKNSRHHIEKMEKVRDLG